MAKNLLSRSKKVVSQHSPASKLPSTERPESLRVDSYEQLDAPGIPTSLAGYHLHFIVESIEAKEAVYELFNFSENNTFSLGVNPFERIIDKNCDIYICHFDNPLGPCVASSFSHTICSYLGAEFQKEVARIVAGKYFGEVPLGSCFCVHSKTPKLTVIFVMLDELNPIYAYHAFRTSLLKVMELSQRQNPSGGGGGGSGSGSMIGNQPKSLNIPEVFQSQSKRSSTPVPLSSSPVAESKLTQSQESQRKLITVPVFTKFGSISQFSVVSQMAEAYKKLKYVPMVPSDLAKLKIQYDKLQSIKPFTDTERRRLFENTVKRNELVRFGISDNKEVDWLLNWISDTNDPTMQLTATTALIEFVRSDRPTMPIDVTRRSVLDGLFSPRCLKEVLDLASRGSITLNKIIDEKSIKVGDVVGQGATAAVYRATYENQTVAFKEFVEGTDLIQFRREVAMMSLLQHPHLVNIIGAGFKQLNPFIVSEFVGKGDLYHILHNEKNPARPSDDILLQWAIDIACGMQYLHSLGIVHRDLKSLNILVSDTDRCKIIDYGTSRVVDTNSNMTGNIGTVYWMAPEMFQNASYTEKVDVYSFGIVLFEIITGDIPFKGENSFSIPVQVTHGTRPPLPKNLSKPWLKLVTKCWADRPARRPTFDKILQMLEVLKVDKVSILQKK